MSEIKAKQFYIYKGRAYEIHNDRSLLEDVMGLLERFDMKVIDAAPILKLLREMGEDLAFIRDIPGLAGLDFTTTKKYREHCIKMTSKKSEESFEKLNTFLASIDKGE